MMPRRLQIDAHQDREGGPDEHADDRQGEVERADVLVVRREQPSPKAGRMRGVAVRSRMFGMGVESCAVGHGGFPSASLAASLVMGAVLTALKFQGARDPASATRAGEAPFEAYFALASFNHSA